MKIDNSAHTVTIPAKDYVALMRDADDKELYDEFFKAFIETLNGIQGYISYDVYTPFKRALENRNIEVEFFTTTDMGKEKPEVIVRNLKWKDGVNPVKNQIAE